jgi:hypothetical protein
MITSFNLRKLPEKAEMHIPLEENMICFQPYVANQLLKAQIDENWP